MTTPIEDYGIIGDLHTVALIGKDGSIDWWCYPRFDSPSVFAKVLDDDIGGHFQIAPLNEEFTRKQLYFPDTNVLITRFMSAEGVGEVTDFMPVRDAQRQKFHHRIVRRIEVVRGAMEFRVTCRPAFNYARTLHETKLVAGGASFTTPELALALVTDAPLSIDCTAVTSTFALKHGECRSFELMELKDAGFDAPAGFAPRSEEEIQASFHDTVKYWRTWLNQSQYHGRWREMVNRSALSLKLLTYAPTGAIVAAPTCSLPELVGGSRNWDYRYTWIRDASFTIYAFLRIGFTEEATAFMGWLKARLGELADDGALQVMYGIDGRHDLQEEELSHLSGYDGSKPVRIGNGAYNQLQLDIYGEMMDAVYLYNKHGTPIGYDLWSHLRKCVDWVCENWQRPDEGIWEVRGGQQRFVYSKLMCWVAVDRALRLADKRSFPAPRARWLAVRDEIYEAIMSQGWDDALQTFVQSFTSKNIDASNLMMPLVFFVGPNDPRMTGTVDAVLKGLTVDSLVYRYRVNDTNDGIDEGEGTFSICTFWLVEVLTRAGRIDEARLIFEKMLTYANHLGLYAEEVGPRGEALGNFPQAFTHLALISAAYNLDRALGGQRTHAFQSDG